MMISSSTRQARELFEQSVLTASPARLVIMLYDRLLVDLGRAEAAQESENWPTAREHLLHAQAIVAELQSSLDTSAWDGGPGLFALYTYVSNALVVANIHRDVEATRESIRLLAPLREAWSEAAQVSTTTLKTEWSTADV
jgi:flagellar protein FliS